MGAIYDYKSICKFLCKQILYTVGAYLLIINTCLLFDIHTQKRSKLFAVFIKISATHEAIPSFRLLGSIKPTHINQINPGNLVRGIKGRACGKTRSNQLNTPKTARTIPNIHSHFGSNFIRSDGIEIPAINNPIGTEKPTPPNPNWRK